jgi:hypothetical protein
VRRYADDDTGYLRWLAEHPDGFVINAARVASTAYLMLHRASCRTVAGVPTHGSRWTGDYIKFCGDRAELERYALESLGGAARACGVCLRAPQAMAPAASRAAPTERFVPSTSRSAEPDVRGREHGTASEGVVSDGWPQRFQRPDSEPIALAVPPRLASWNKAGDPDQVRLERFLAAAEELVVAQLQRLPDPLALRLDVGLPASVRLLEAHDLDNYLFPLITRLTKTTGRQFVSVWCTKRHSDRSFIRLERARLDPTPGNFDRAKLLTTWMAGQSTAFKEQLRDQLAGLDALEEGPVTLQLGFTVGRHRNWANLWKPAIDSLDQLLGRTRPDRDWHPRDGRIVELGLHCRTRADRDNKITIALGATTLHRVRSSWPD